LLLISGFAIGNPVLEGNFFPHPADQPIRFRLTDCSGGEEVTLRLTLYYGEERWESWATFTADRSGFVNPELISPIEGTYQEADPMGLFWSMVPEGEELEGKMFLPTGLEPLRYVLKIQAGEEVLQQRTFQRFFQASNVERSEIREEGLVGTFFKPEGEKPAPGVLILGGTEGGLNEPKAALLANRGYATLTLAYFGLEDLPEKLGEIPIEYFKRAVTWLEKQEGVKSDSIVVLGNSKGAEAALLLGAIDSRIAGVIAIAPSNLVWQGLDIGEISSSWTIEGEPLPFIPFLENSREEVEAMAGLHGKSLENIEVKEETIIPVEKIQGPILLVSGSEDSFWPSSKMGDLIVRRLEELEFPHTVKHREFPGAGHIFRIPYLPSLPKEENGELLFGGNKKKNSAAEAQVWQEILTFLENF